MSIKLDNPFYHNYVFTKDDISRVKFNYLDHPFLLFRTTYVQINDGYAFKYKCNGSGQIFLIGYEEIKPIDDSNG